MMLQSHLLATILGALILSRFVRFTPTDWALALAFGVAMDVDHLLQVPKYLAAHGASGFNLQASLAYGAAWQGFMHTAWALLLVVPAVAFFRSPAPLLFWGLHLFLDFVIAKRYVVWGSPLEWGIIAALAAAVGAVALLDPVAQASAREALASWKHSMLAREIPVQGPAERAVEPHALESRPRL